MEEIGPRVIFEIGEFKITNTFLSLQIISILTLIISFWLSYKPQEEIIKKRQSLVEVLIEMFQRYLGGFLGEEKALKYFPFFSNLFLFILLSNWSGLIPGFNSPTSDLNVTIGLALGTIIYIQYVAVKEKGKKYLKNFISPSPLFLPINILEQITRPVSLALRLFGNITGEHIVLAIISLIAPLIVPVPIMALSMFMGFIQALIFTTLSAAYLASVFEE
ncbi:MAG: F0F1 ATP synthase subunit A [Dictyoglomus sp.]|nr:F0F1 ATP synthase subunit A [Dictyoglomus sp.]MCX7845634.1 F0F1 ATP synthase subunit A [Dictyoglomaceae bacterium]MDW8189129.1 F0F1 ATP synthase subunit A [Dictyoglomus sp.]